MALRRRSRQERGSAAVEFALIMPIFLMLLFGIVDFGYAINRSSMINNATRDGVREASLGGNEADVRRVTAASLGNFSGATVRVTCRTPADAQCGSNYDLARSTGGTAVVTIEYRHSLLTPVGIFFPDGLDMTRKAEMRIE